MVSMVMPLFNEERLISKHLELAAPFFNEIILVDGSPMGPSTDKIRDVIKAANFDNVQVIEGTFETADRKGGWNRGAQIEAGVEVSQGDILIITSCDCVYSDYEALMAIIKDFPDGKVYYSFVQEFFIDTNHVRLVSRDGYPLPQVGQVIVDKKVFDPTEPALFNWRALKPNEFIYMPDISKFHYGWVTDFKKQVQKHIRNLLSGGWGEYGEEILKGDACAIDTWAITHVSNYTKEIIFPYTGTPHHPFSQFDFSYLDNFDKVMESFKKKHKKDYLECI